MTIIEAIVIIFVLATLGGVAGSDAETEAEACLICVEIRKTTKGAEAEDAELGTDTERL